MDSVRQCSFILQGHAYIRDTPIHGWECPVIATHEWESESGSVSTTSVFDEFNWLMGSTAASTALEGIATESILSCVI